jgi:hypothetical protein
MPRHCEHVALPSGGVAIVCGDGPRSRIICDVCDKPVPKGTPGFIFHGKHVDLCPACQAERAKGDPEWRRFAEQAIAHNLGLSA